MNSGTNIHFLRHFQQHSPCSTVHVSISPLPPAWRKHHTAQHHPKLEPQVTLHPASLDGAVSVQGKRKVSMAFHLMGVSGWVSSPKGQTQHLKPRTSPGCRKKTTPGYTAPSSSVFPWILEQAPAHHLCDAADKGSQSLGKVTPTGTGFFMGRCRKFADGYRSLPVR